MYVGTRVGRSSWVAMPVWAWLLIGPLMLCWYTTKYTVLLMWWTFYVLPLYLVRWASKDSTRVHVKKGSEWLRLRTLAASRRLGNR